MSWIKALHVTIAAIILLGASLFIFDAMNPETPDPVVVLRLAEFSKTFFAAIQFIVGIHVVRRACASDLHITASGFLPDADSIAEQRQVCSIEMTCIRRC